MKRLVSLALMVFAVGCEGITDPTTSQVAGAYEAVEFTATTAGDVVDQLAGGAQLEITLADDGTTSGTLFVPGGGEGGGDLQADLSGSWTLEGDTVAFDHAADTFIRDMPFRYRGGRLIGDETFGETRVQVVLAMTEDREAKLTESWIRNAESWTTAVREGRIESRRAVTDQAIVDAVLSCGGSQVLDVGCGEGWLARRLSSHGLDVVGFDGSARLVEQAQELGGGSFRVLSYSELAEAPNAVGEEFDVVVSNFSLLGKDIGNLLRALTRVTAARGRLVVQTVHPATMTERPHEDGWHEERFEPLEPLKFSRMPWFFRTLESWRSALANGGWRIAETREPVDARTEMAASLLLIAEQQ